MYYHYSSYYFEIIKSSIDGIHLSQRQTIYDVYSTNALCFPCTLQIWILQGYSCFHVSWSNNNVVIKTTQDEDEHQDDFPNFWQSYVLHSSYLVKTIIYVIIMDYKFQVVPIGSCHDVQHILCNLNGMTTFVT